MSPGRGRGGLRGPGRPAGQGAGQGAESGAGAWAGSRRPGGGMRAGASRVGARGSGSLVVTPHGFQAAPEPSFELFPLSSPRVFPGEALTQALAANGAAALRGGSWETASLGPGAELRRPRRPWSSKQTESRQLRVFGASLCLAPLVDTVSQWGCDSTLVLISPADVAQVRGTSV